MQIDMHFFGTYALARAAGLPPAVAKTVATAAQYVDEAEQAESFRLKDGEPFKTVVSSHGMLRAENLNEGDQWRVWMPYHFLPGGVGASDEERLICRPGEPGNQATDAVIAFALDRKREPCAAHLLGVVSHVIEDTYSHHGFSGVTSDYNKANQDSIGFNIQDEGMAAHVHHKIDLNQQKILGTGGELARMGHGAVGELPDRPFLKWNFDYEMGLDLCPRLEGSVASLRDNPSRYLAAARRIYDICRGFAENNPLVPEPLRFRPFSGIEARLRDILAFEGVKEHRSERWKQACLDGWLYDQQRQDEDDFIVYEPTMFQTDGLAESDAPHVQEAYLFHQASRLYRGYVLDRLVPIQLGLSEV